MGDKLQTNYAFLIGTSAICAYILILLCYYICRRKTLTAPILQILALLLLNELLEAVFEMIPFIEGIGNAACSISLIGKTAFAISANFWVIFITRLTYRERLAPGKFLNLVKFVSRNLVITYIPSIAISIFLCIVINVTDSSSESDCFRIVTSKDTFDYIIYFTAFIIPNLIAFLIVLVYLILYKMLEAAPFTLFLIYPLISLLFNGYYIAVKLYLFIKSADIIENMEIPFIVEPLIYGLSFMYVLMRSVKHSNARPQSSQVTIKDDSVGASFIEDPDPK